LPYLRLYSRDVPLKQKRVIASKLIEITLHALDLRPEERSRITIQFIPVRQSWIGDVVPSDKVSPGAELTVEVNDHDLTEEKKRAFAEEAAPILAGSLRGKTKQRIAGLLGNLPDPARQVEFQFNEMDAPDTPSATDGMHEHYRAA
jgi:hypothetical protein